MEGLRVFDKVANLLSFDFCEVDKRRPRLLLKLPHAMNDLSIAEHKNIGGIDKLTECRPTMGQLIHHMHMARSGLPSIFNKWRQYLLYMEGTDDPLVTVDVGWDAIGSKWRVDAFRFGQHGKWDDRYEVYGN
jgi:hypothetical protein